MILYLYKIMGIFSMENSTFPEDLEFLNQGR